VGVTLSAENKRQLYVPEGFAHGFVVTGDVALFSYKFTAYCNSEAERFLLWDEPNLGIDRPIETPVLSARDGSAPRLEEVPTEELPRYVSACAEKTGQMGQS
jgi:dTDP-4-dehydrorhamnose 3,5-epimerase